MRKLILAAALALSLPGCATLTDTPAAPLAQTHIDEQALTAAYSSFDVVLTGILNMAGAFHFTANKQAEKASDNTGKAFDAIKAASGSTPPPDSDPDVILKPGETAQAEDKQ